MDILRCNAGSKVAEPNRVANLFKSIAGLSKMAGSLRILWVFVWVPFQGRLPVCFLDELRIHCAVWQAQDFVVLVKRTKELRKHPLFFFFPEILPRVCERSVRLRLPVELTPKAIIAP